MSTYSATVLQDVPSLYWRLGESSGTNANDETANNRDGTYVSTTLGITGALTGDADTAINAIASQYVTCTYTPFTLNSQRTFEVWANRTNTTNISYLWATSANPSPQLRLTAASSDVVFAPDSNQAATTWTAAWPGVAQWVHCVLTFDDATNALDLWLNGVSAGATTNTNTWAATASTFQLAQRGGAVGYWKGGLDEVAIYESILSTARIKHHYNVGRGLIGVPKRRAARAVTAPAVGAVYR